MMTLKEKAINYLKALGVYAPFIRNLKGNKKMFYIAGMGYTIDGSNEENKRIADKIEELEADGEKFVYGVTINSCYGEKMYSFLYVTEEDEELPCNCSLGSTDSYDAECGEIGVTTRWGGLVRTC